MPRHLAAAVLVVLLGGLESLAQYAFTASNSGMDGDNFQTHNNKVVWTPDGIFVSGRNGADNGRQIRRSADGGTTWTTVFTDTSNAGGTYTKAASLETDGAGNVYAIYPDYVANANRFLKFSSSNGYSTPVVNKTFSSSSIKLPSSKYAACYDPVRDRIYYATQAGALLTYDTGGNVVATKQVYTTGSTAGPHYPYLFVDAVGTIHYANTTVDSGEAIPYQSIRYVRSADGGSTWMNMAGIAISLSANTADVGGPSTMINLASETVYNTWLANMHVIDGQAHFVYQTRNPGTPAAVGSPPTITPFTHYMRFDATTGSRVVDDQGWQAETLTINATGASFASDPNDPTSPLFAAGGNGQAKSGANSFDGRRVSVLVSFDNGATWHDQGVSPLYDATTNASLSRSTTPDGRLIGSFGMWTAPNGVSVNDVGFFQMSTGYQYFDASSAAGGGLGGGPGTATGANFSRDAGQTLARVTRTAGDTVLFKVAGATTAAKTYTYTTAGSQSYRHWAIGNGNVVTADFTASGTQTFTGDILVQGTSTLVWNAANSWLAGSPGLMVNDDSTARFANDAAATTTLQFAALSFGPGGNRLETTSGTVDLNLRFSSIAGSSDDVISLAARTILTVDTTMSGTFASAMEGPGAFVKDGSGTLALTSNNAISGTTSVIGGTLLVGVGGTTGAVAGPIAVGSGGTFVYNRSDSDTTYANPISGAGIFRKQGAGEVGLTGVNTFTGRIVVADGKVAFAGTGSENGMPDVAVEAGSILSVGSAFVGGTATIGTLSGAGLVDTAFGTTAGTRTLRIDQSANATFSGTLANTTSGSNVRTLAVVKAGAAILTLSGTANTLAGGVRLQAGILRASANGSLGAAGSDITFTAGGSGALMNNAGPLTLDSARQVILEGDGALQAGWTQDITVTGRVTGAGGMTIRADVTPGWVVFSGSNDYMGTTIVEAGANLRLSGGANRIRSGNAVIVEGTLDMNACGQTFGACGGGGLIRTGGAVLTVGSGGGSSTFAGVISEGGGLTKTGTGRLMLTGSNTYTGVTVVNAGVLRIGDGGASGSLSTSSTISIAVGAVLELNRSGAVSMGLITGAGSVVKNGSGTLSIASGSDFSGGLTLNAGSLDFATSTALGTGTFTVNSGTFGSVGAFGRTFGNPIVFNGNATFGSAGPNATIRATSYNGSVNLGGATRILTVSQTTWLNGTISNGGLTKAGTYTLTLAGANAYTDPTTVQAGILRLAHPAALATSRVVPLTGGTLTLAPGLQATVGGLSPNAGGLVDVGSGMVTVAAGLAPADLVTALAAGRSDGSWNGTSGITSSVAAADVASSIPRAVGWLDNGDGSVAFAYSAPGDTNLDWAIDILDAGNFLAGGKFDTGLPAAWLEGDFSYDGLVDILDAADFFATGLYDTGTYNANQAAIAAVPEPTGLIAAAMLPGAALWIAARRRRNA